MTAAADVSRSLSFELEVTVSVARDRSLFYLSSPVFAG